MKERQIIDTFFYPTSFKIHRGLQCGYPLITLVGMMLMAGVVGNAGDFLSEGWMPVILIGSVVWLTYEVVRTVQACSFSVEISDDSIRIGKTVIPWADVAGADFTAGKSSAVVLRSKSSGGFKIPANIEGLDFILGVLKARVPGAAIVNPQQSG